MALELEDRNLMFSWRWHFIDKWSLAYQGREENKLLILVFFRRMNHHFHGHDAIHAVHEYIELVQTPSMKRKLDLGSPLSKW